MHSIVSITSDKKVLKGPGRPYFNQKNRAHSLASIEQIDFVTFSDKREQDRILSSINIQPIDLSEEEVDQLVLFLESLTGRSGNQRPLGKPNKVPSGLTID